MWAVLWGTNNTKQCAYVSIPCSSLNYYVLFLLAFMPQLFLISLFDALTWRGNFNASNYWNHKWVKSLYQKTPSNLLLYRHGTAPNLPCFREIQTAPLSRPAPQDIPFRLIHEFVTNFPGKTDTVRGTEKNKYQPRDPDLALTQFLWPISTALPLPETLARPCGFRGVNVPLIRGAVYP